MNTLTPEDAEVCKQAILFAKSNRQKLAAELTNTEYYLIDEKPVSVFMAGSPGAGKTEASKRLLQEFGDEGQKIIRIDPDEYRTLMPGYNKKNSSLFQYPTSIIADAVHDLALHNGQSFIFDSTLSNKERARENIQRSLKRKRKVQILYIYQEPTQAWEFVKEREKKEGRAIPKDAFIAQYINARQNVNDLKDEFGSNIEIDLIAKNIDGSNLFYKDNIDKIDNHIPERYSKDKLDELIT